MHLFSEGLYKGVTILYIRFQSVSPITRLIFKFLHSYQALVFSL